jgi:hypothetical protein
MPGNEIKFVGLDVFVISEKNIPQLPEKLGECSLVQITNRGSKVWPGTAPTIQMTDLYTARYKCASNAFLDDKNALEILSGISHMGLNWVHVEKLLHIDGVDRFS